MGKKYNIREKGGGGKYRFWTIIYTPAREFRFLAVPVSGPVLPYLLGTDQLE
jgi:hypothetical protein